MLGRKRARPWELRHIGSTQRLVVRRALGKSLMGELANEGKC